jgi:hydrogenase maturation protease
MRNESRRRGCGRCPTLVLGIGNILLRDEGVGVRVVEAVQRINAPSNVELVDGGTAGLDLLDVVADRRKVIVIDAVQADKEPGTVFRFGADDFAPQGVVTISLHQVGLLETLMAAKHLGCAPRQVVIFGIEPKEMGYGLELSAEVAAVVPKVVELVFAELQA